MKLFVLSILIFLAAFPANAQQKEENSAPGIEWLSDFAQANRIAVQSGKPMLLDFTAVWCKACREMDAVFWTRADVIKAAKDFVPVKIDLDANGKLADKYGVAFLPNLVMTDAWGNALVFHRGFGRRSDSEIIEKLGSTPKDFAEIKESGNRLLTDKNNRAALSKMAEFYQQKDFYYLSSEFYGKLLKQEKNAAERERITLILGFNYLKIGWTDDARRIFDAFEKDFPKSTRADENLYGKFSAAAQKNFLEEAAKILTELKTKFPQSNFINQAEQNMQAYQLQAK